MNFPVNHCEQSRNPAAGCGCQEEEPYNENMLALPTWATLVAIAGALFGALIVGAVWLICASRKRRADSASRQADPIPAEDFVRVLPMPAVLLDRHMEPLFHNNASEEKSAAVRRTLQEDWLQQMVARTLGEGTATSRPSDFDNQESIHVLPLPGQRVAVLVSNEAQQYQAETLRQDFIANASHELNTPVSAILLLSEALQMRVQGDKRALRFVESLHQEAERLASLTRDIARLAAAQQGVREGVAVAGAVTEVSPAVADVLESRRALADAAEVYLDLEVTPGAQSCRVPVEEKSLQVALENLVENAIQHSRAGDTVRVRVQRGEGNAEPTVQVQVIDCGDGIADEHLGKIFQRFYRTDNSRARRSGGTGLGLAIVRNIARGFGGDVTVTSQVGAGSTFTLTAPALTDPVAHLAGPAEEEG